MARNSVRSSVDFGKGAKRMSRHWSQFSEKVQHASREAARDVPVQAHSLQWLHELADEPTHNLSGLMPTGAETLILYIAQVPGSNDIFLSPMKPRDDRVTPEDISSALYILHQEDLDTFHDRTREIDTNPEQETQVDSGINSQHNIQRKPIHVDAPKNGEGTRSQEQHRTHSIRRKPVDNVIKPEDAEARAVGVQNPAQQNGSSSGEARPSFDMSLALRLGIPIEEYRNIYGVPLHHRGLIGPRDAPMSLCRLRPDANAAIVARIIDPHRPTCPEQRPLVGAILEDRQQDKGHMYIDMIASGYKRHEVDACYIPGLNGAEAFTRRLSRGDSASPMSPDTVQDPVATGKIRGGRDFPASADQGELGKRVSWRSIMQRTRPYTHAAVGYGFQSPWSMRCEFKAAFRDNVIKCVSEAGTLSELRFHILSKLDKRSPSPTKGSGELDLSLGQASLGGGANGELAKLAKLVVYPEGLKMLDLLVSANMLVFMRIRDEKRG